MTGVALPVSLILILIVVAALHPLRAPGRWFPIGDEAEQVKAVVGVEDAERMPGAIRCAIVAAPMLGARFAVLAMEN